MAAIPPHFSDRYINQRYKKALQIVQHLPASASFQPTREEKLELYAYYKQATHGDVHTQRPGMFDMVGRAKWDAWKKLQGISQLQAKHTYVDILLRSATEAYKRNVGRATAQQIIQTFSAMRPSGDNDSDDDMTDTQNEDDDSSIASADAEEKAYLQAIENSVGKMTPISTPQSQNNTFSRDTPTVRPTSRTPSVQTRQTNRRSWYESRRPDSVASTQSGQVSLVTAPTPSGRLSQASDLAFHNTEARASPVRPTRSSVSPHPQVPSQPSLKNPNTDRLLPHMIPPHERTPSRLSRSTRLLAENLDDPVNPWAQTPRIQARRRASYSGNSDSDSDNNNDNDPERRGSGRAAASQASNTPTSASPLPFRATPSRPPTSHSPRPQARSRFKPTQRPAAGTPFGAASPTTVEAAVDSSSSLHTITDHRLKAASESGQAMSVVALGPATKRALQSLQAEVVALNDRIDDLRQELMERDQPRRPPSKQGTAGPSPDQGRSKSGDDNETWDGWKWVLKAAAKHAAINVITVVAIVMILYSRESPIAYAITGQFSRMWHNIRLRVVSGTA